jgi:uracil-DNA glycosylase
MDSSLKEKIVESLKDQKEIFGDELFEELAVRKTQIESRNKNSDKQDSSMSKKKLNSFEVYDKQFEPNDCEDPAKQAIETWELSESLEKLHKSIGNCTKCILHEGRNKFVFGVGNANADVMCIGEGPGAEEDKQGYPFVGRAGKLLTDILKAIKFSRDDVFIGNVIKCRPPGNRTPLPSEMDTCSPYLLKQIDLIQPKLILCLGLTAAQGLLNKRDSLTSMRGKIFDFRKSKVMVTYHPAALLRNPQWKKGCWEDVQKFRKLYDELN